jgi:hypothetical protein
MNNPRPFWQFPWRYREAVAFVGGVVATGFILQVTVGAFDFTLLRFPGNMMLGCGIFVFLSLISLKRKSPLYQWFSGAPLAVALIGALVVLTVVMGLTPQNPSVHTHGNLLVRFGLTHMTSAWSFVLIYFFTLLSLGAVIVRRLFGFRIRDYAFYLNHIGLWLLLFAAGAGAADVRRYVMHIHKGELEWRVFNHRGETLDLPIAIELNDFYIEYWSLDTQRPVPKRFVSDINIYSEDGKQAHTLLEVNKPCKMGHWMLYQYGYDSNAGSMSRYSSIELVYDPWIMAVYAGIIMLSCGSVCMLWAGKKRKEERHDVE